MSSCMFNVQCTLDLLQLCRRTWPQLFAAVITHSRQLVVRRDGEVLACFLVVVKMYRYSLEERVFIVKTYWITGSIKNC
jgi:hypothetical protein